MGMSEQDKQEIRKIIREELANQPRLLPLGNPCFHEWVFSSGGSFCRKCGTNRGVSIPGTRSITNQSLIGKS